VEIVPGWEPGDGARHCALADSVSAALALRLAAAVMAAGAVLVVTAFEKIGFIAPDPARRSEGLSRPGRRSCLSRPAGTNPHRLSAVDPGPCYRESSPCHSDRVAVLMTPTKRTRSAARSNLLLPLPAAL
jgi:hypothetical protein